MEPYEVYRLYLALKLHFTTKKYDITQTKGVVNSKKENFLKRKDLTSIRKLARDYTKKEIINILVANFVSGDKWGGIFDTKSSERYKQWLVNIEKLQYNFAADLDKIIFRMEQENIISAIDDTNHPLILKLVMGNEIKLETVVMLEKLLPFIGKFTSDFVLEDLCLLVTKYKPFVRFDKDSILKRYEEKIHMVYGNV